MHIREIKFLRYFAKGIEFIITSTNRFFYLYLQIRDKKNAMLYIYNGGHINSVLKNQREVKDSIQKIKKLRLKPHNDMAKNWDTYRAFSFILKHADKKANILDVGCASYGGFILPWLELYGFLNLFGCDILFNKDFKKGKIEYYKQDLQNTTFHSCLFDFITSISVIEHGVDVDSYLKEMSRLLKVGGYLLTSTDYWCERTETRKIYPYGKKFGEMKIFTKNDIEKLNLSAKKYCLELIEPIDFTYKDKVVYWKRVDKKFTFIFFILKKIGKKDNYWKLAESQKNY